MTSTKMLNKIIGFIFKTILGGLVGVFCAFVFIGVFRFCLAIKDWLIASNINMKMIPLIMLGFVVGALVSFSIRRK